MPEHDARTRYPLLSSTTRALKPAFSAHVGEPIAPTDKLRLEDTAAYLVRNPLSLKKLVYLDGQQAVLYRSRMNPSLGRNFEAMDPSSGSPASVITSLTPASTVRCPTASTRTASGAQLRNDRPSLQPPAPSRRPGGAAPRAGPG